MLDIVFLGTPEYVLPIINMLHNSFRDSSGKSPIVAVVTQRPKPAGRKQTLEYSAVDTWAHKRGIPKYFLGKDLINENIKADVGILASYGEILKKEVVDHFPKGIINIHPSLLPKYRGSSPVQAAITLGEEKTGVSFTKMDENLDKGLLISSFTEDILPDDTTETLRERLYMRSADVLKKLIPAYIDGKAKLTSIDNHPGTFTTRVDRSHAFIPSNYIKAALDGKTTDDDWDISFINNFTTKPTPKIIERFVRAMQSWPTAWTTIKVGKDTKRLKIHKTHLDNGKLVIDEVQLEGKNEVSYKQFREGYADADFE